MSNLDKNSEAKSCCQQEQNADSGKMPLAAEAGCCSTGSASDLSNKAILPILWELNPRHLARQANTLTN